MKAVEKAYNFIKMSIMNGDFKENESLIEEKLAAQINVSRSTVKKVLLTLEGEGVVTLEKNKGAKVKHYSKAELLELYDIRAALECLVICNIIACGDEKKVASLLAMRPIIESMKANNDLLHYIEVDDIFHETLYSCSEAKLTVQMLRNLTSQIRRYSTRTAVYVDQTEKPSNDHLDMLNALEAKDTEAAKKAVCEHVRRMKNIIEQYYA